MTLSCQCKMYDPGQAIPGPTKVDRAGTRWHRNYQEELHMKYSTDTPFSPAISDEKRVCTWLRQRICPFCWGSSDRFKTRRTFHRVTKAHIRRFYPVVSRKYSTPTEPL